MNCGRHRNKMLLAQQRVGKVGVVNVHSISHPWTFLLIIIFFYWKVKAVLYLPEVVDTSCIEIIIFVNYNWLWQLLDLSHISVLC